MTDLFSNADLSAAATQEGAGHPRWLTGVPDTPLPAVLDAPSALAGHSGRELRPHQEAAIGMLRASLRNGKKRPILQIPTGGGKTKCAAEIIRMALAKGNRVCFTVPALSLIDQAFRAFYQDGIAEVGVIQANHPNTDYGKPVQIASVQTLVRRGFPETDLVIVDECHVRYKVIDKWMADRPDLKFIGLSATPWTKGLGKFYDDLISPIAMDGLIEQGYLSPYRIFAPSHPDLSQVKTVAGDYHEGQLSEVMSGKVLVGNAVETWLRLGQNRNTLCYAVDRAHARHLQDRFQSAGVACGYIDAQTERIERDQIIRQMHEGRIRVIVNIATMIMGVDADVRCILFCRPTKSKILWVQACGRMLRTAPGKDYALLLDHSDTALRLGLPSDIQQTELDDGKPKKAANGSEKSNPLPKECKACGALRPRGFAACPHCGHKPELPMKAPKSIDGQLVEITRGKGTQATGAKNTATIKDVMTLRGITIPLGSFYGQLLSFGLDRGFKPGWAANQYKSAIGTWPNAYRNQAPEVLSDAVHSWCMSRIIAFAKAKKKSSRESNMEELE